MRIENHIEYWPFRRPFHIAGYTFDSSTVLVVTVESQGLVGRGEASGVYYHGETADGMVAQIEGAIGRGAGLDRRDLATLLPAGGARNALDCALWDLEAKQVGRSVWSLMELTKVHPLLTTYSLGAEDPGAMAETAAAYADARALKLKLLGDEADSERVQAVRAARPDVWMSVDANQGLTPDSFHRLLPSLVSARIALVEQPFPVDRDADLEGLDSPIPIAADESVQDSRDLERIRGRFDAINIKLDKCGGLTEALAMATEARRMGLKLMVGNTIGTSLSTAPGFVLGQFCDFIDLDGPMLLARDRVPSVTYKDGRIHCSDDIWGSAHATTLPSKTSS